MAKKRKFGDGARDVEPPRERDRLAGVDRLELRELVEVLLDEIGELAAGGRERSAAGVRDHAGNACLRRADGVVDVALVAVGNRGDDVGGRGIDVVEVRAGTRRDEFAVDEIRDLHAGGSLSLSQRSAGVRAGRRRGVTHDTCIQVHQRTKYRRTRVTPAVHRSDASVPLRSTASAFQIFFRSSVNRRISSWRASSVGARRIDDGWTVAVTNGARGDSTNCARWIETRNFGPITACAAVEPRQTMARGLITAISASSQGRQAVISAAFGFLWMRRLPRGSHLKCLTTFVT